MVARRYHHGYSYAEYLALEADANVRHEYFDGSIYAMAGGSREHAALASNLTLALGVQLRGRPCQPHSSDLRVRVPPTGLATYPDVTVICGEVELDPEDPKQHTVVNPILVCEVLSPSTEDNDRGEKLENYKQLGSLRHAVLVAHERRAIDVWSRDDGGAWTSMSYGTGERATLQALAVELDVDELYRDPLHPGRDLTRAAR